MFNELVKLLKKNNKTISTAESLTGGLIASKIVDIAGSSVVLNETYVTYSNEAKMRILGVKAETIDKYDVVSTEVTEEMAEGLFKISNADICVATSGYAGPTGKNVGKVCITLKVGDYYYSFINNYSSEAETRNSIREKTANFV
jgi:nicotinamide-nucleotide amidase